MRLFVPKRLKFVGPDPPPEEPVPAEPEVPVVEAPKKGKAAEPIAPVEIPRTEEQKAGDKLFAKFIKQLRREVSEMSFDLAEYRTLTMGPGKIKKVALWPKVLTEAEIEVIKEKENARIEAERARMESA
jgi:hypothetical protein